MTVADSGIATPPPLRVALLRGINLGQSRSVSMAELAELAQGLGWQKVRTHLRSGNLVFAAHGSASKVSAALKSVLAGELGLEVDVIVRSGPEVAELIAGYPFGRQDPSRQVIACCDRPIDPQAETRLIALATPAEQVLVRGADVFAYFPDGQASSKLAAGMLAALRPATGTARNLNTMAKLADLLGSA
jgi:uncharacterized protein (DUF1697 family)